MDQILIFKTDVNAREQVRKAEAILQSITFVKHWNFDLEDCDRILRVVTAGIQPGLIEKRLRSENIYCEHLEYKL